MKFKTIDLKLENFFGFGHLEKKDKLKRSILIRTLLITVILGSCWSIFYFFLGIIAGSIVVGSYAFVSLVNLLLYRFSGNYRIFRNVQLILILLLPTGTQLALGGFSSGSSVMLAAILCPLGALMFYSVRVARYFYWLFILSVVFAGIMEWVYSANLNSVDPKIMIIFFVLNLISICSIIFFSVEYYVNQTNFLQRKLEEKNKEISKIINTIETQIESRTFELLREKKISEQFNKNLEKSNEVIRKSLLEKEILLKEVHHRVKNNLQIISSLLSLQAQNIRDENSLNKFMDTRMQIGSMAIIHELLYNRGNFAEINMFEYCQNLIQHISLSFDTFRCVEFSLEGEKDIKFNLNQSVPCGLIINEVLTNAIKHAFPERENGKVHLSLKQDEENNYVSIYDDGVGIPEGFDPKRGSSLGLRLVEDLVSQIDGKHSFHQNDGFRFDLVFPI